MVLLPREARRKTKALKKVITVTSHAGSVPASKAVRHHTHPVLYGGKWALAGERHLSSARTLAAEGAAATLGPTAMRAQTWLRQRPGQGPCSEEELCMGGDDREFSQFSFPLCYYFELYSSPPTPLLPGPFPPDCLSPDLWTAA